MPYWQDHYGTGRPLSRRMSNRIGCAVLAYTVLGLAAVLALVVLWSIVFD